MKYLLSWVVCFVASTAAACSLSPDADSLLSLEANLENSTYHAVIVGTVESVEYGETLVEGRAYTIDVEHVLHEQGSPKISTPHTLRTPGHSCGSRYEPGDIAMWFLDEDMREIHQGTPQYRFTSVEEALKKVAADVVESIPSNCKVWFDGCNTCTRSKAGEDVACTEMACVDHGISLCERYFSPQEGAPFVSGPRTSPLDNFVGPQSPPPTRDTVAHETPTDGSRWGHFAEFAASLWLWLGVASALLLGAAFGISRLHR